MPPNGKEETSKTSRSNLRARLIDRNSMHELKCEYHKKEDDGSDSFIRIIAFEFQSEKFQIEEEV